MILHVASFWNRIFSAAIIMKYKNWSWILDQVMKWFIPVIHQRFHVNIQKNWCPSIRVFPKIGGKPTKWMVKIMENPIKMDDLGIPYIFWKHPSQFKSSPKNTPQNAFPNDTPQPSWILGQSFLQSMWPSTQRNDHCGFKQRFAHFGTITPNDLYTK